MGDYQTNTMKEICGIVHWYIQARAGYLKRTADRDCRQRHPEQAKSNPKAIRPFFLKKINFSSALEYIIYVCKNQLLSSQKKREREKKKIFFHYVTKFRILKSIIPSKNANLENPLHLWTPEVWSGWPLFLSGSDAFTLDFLLRTRHSFMCLNKLCINLQNSGQQ